MKLDKESLDYVEAQVNRLTMFRLESMELLNKRSNVLITLQLGGGGGLAVFAVNLLGKDGVPPVIFLGVIIASVMLFILAIFSVMLLMFTEPILPPGNEPEGLFQEFKVLSAQEGSNSEPAARLLVVRKTELDYVQERQDQWRTRNDKVGIRLNILYFFTAAVPFAASALAAMAR